MGEVFLADDTQLERKVAITFLSEVLEADGSARERRYREALEAAHTRRVVHRDLTPANVMLTDDGHVR